MTLAVMTACDSNRRHAPFLPEPVAGNESTVLIYRPQKMANAIYSPELLIDGELRADIDNGNKYLFRIAPGKHSIELAPSDQYAGDTSLELTAQAGTAYYLRIDTRIRLDDATAGYAPYVRSFDLVQVDPALAIEQISDCCTEQERAASDERPGKAEQQPSPGETPRQEFTTDKTSNPFGR